MSETTLYEIVDDRFGNDSTPTTLENLIADCRDLWPDEDMGLHVVGREIRDARGEVVGTESRPIGQKRNDEMSELIAKLEYAKKAVRDLLDSPESLVDFHGIAYWAGVVESLREQIKAAL